ncbi:unnamed protein product [Brassica napus]|uniref:(rape) hypothetical protein n=1 Tax=Brassica napus TaxID=3708 RepID=A0A816KEH7_BRANA|nr:unnamed protein product [Brassica napus]
MNLELPVFDGFRCHYRLLRVQVKLISELVNGCLKEKFMFRDWSIFYSNHKIFSSSTTSPMFLVVHLFKLKDNHQMEFCYGVSVSGKLSRLLKGRFSGLLSLSSSDEEGSRWFFRSRHDALFLCTTTAWFHHLPRFFWFDGNTGHMNLAFVRIWSETCPSDCEGTSQSFAHQTRDCSSNGEVWGYGFMMTCSKISKHVFSSNMQGFGNLRSLNLTSCKRPTQFPDLLKATNLEAVKPSSCVNWEV